MEELMLKVDHISKQYKLGQIGGTTLRDELQRKRAKLRGEEDPTKIIGTKNYKYGEKFMALDDVSFEVKKGERVGIIGHNGAGKSTLLKLLSRVTAPTEGAIYLDGRVASMLEVGTGFHPELTGRENIYMNGAILGMTKKEIDSKIEDIIDFSECRQFIDTPIKRYSSGMYVKLAFSVAAHLDSEIMIMDEVLAVGDMAFQKKCLDKMNDVSRKDGRTILYVSHNMNTIRQLCERCIVLDRGKIIFDGDVEEAITIYLNNRYIDLEHDLSKWKRLSTLPKNPAIRFKYCDYIRDEEGMLRTKIHWECNEKFHDIYIRFEFRTAGIGVGTSVTSKPINIEKKEAEFLIDTSNLAPAKYEIGMLAFQRLNNTVFDIDGVRLPLFVKEYNEDTYRNSYYANWGYVILKDAQIL